jgi:nitrogen fixation protein NifU and related proteins
MTDSQKATDEFDRFVEDLQQEVDRQAQAVYSAKLIEEASYPDHVGRMEAPDAYGRSMGWCGDMMEFYLRLDGERIEEVRFMTDGCGPTLACGNVLARMIEGLTLDQAGDVLPEQIVEALEGLPEEHFHCAELAVSTFQNAMFSWRFKQQAEGD